jgi:hypothetical protein
VAPCTACALLPFLPVLPYNRSVRLGRRLLLLGCVGCLAWSAAPAASPADQRANVEDLTRDASALPAEFATDLLIRLAGSPAVDAPEKRTLLDSAFMRAYGAQQPYKRAAPPPQTPIDSRTGGLTRAYATGLDMLTLQVRATQAMLAVNPARARELFEWIDFYLPPASCDTALVPVADEYYAALATMARRTFGSRASAENNASALRFFELYLWRAHLPSEIPAIAKAVRTMRLPMLDAAYIEAALQAIIDRLDRDARGVSTYGLDIVSTMNELANDNRNQGVSGEAIMRGARKLLIAQLSAARCADSITDGPIVELFNATVQRKDLPRDIVPPIAATEARPARALGRATVDRYWQAPEAQRLWTGLGRLRDAAGFGVRGALIKRTSDWQMQAQSYLLDLERWDGAREPVDRDYFDEKALLFDGYLSVVQAGALHTRAVRSLVEFLRRSRLTGRESRSLWFAHLSRLLEQRDPATIPAMEQSGDDILSTYARAERMLTQKR